jgi:hypothetical protein
MVFARVALLVGVLVLTGCAANRPADGRGGGGTPSSGPSGVAVTGTVAAAPACPGPERLDSPCPPRPVAGAQVEMEATGTAVATTTTDDAGRFRFVVPPGNYRITAHNVGYQSQNSQDITVAGALDLTMVVDSGMR